MTEPEKLAEIRKYLDRAADDPDGGYEAEGRHQAEFLRGCYIEDDDAETGDPDYVEWAAAHLQNLAKAALAMAADVRAIGKARPLFSHGHLVLFTDPDDPMRPRRLLGMYFTREAAEAAADRCVAGQDGDDAEMVLGPAAAYEILPVSFQD